MKAHQRSFSRVCLPVGRHEVFNGSGPLVGAVGAIIGGYPGKTCGRPAVRPPEGQLRIRGAAELHCIQRARTACRLLRIHFVRMVHATLPDKSRILTSSGVFRSGIFARRRVACYRGCSVRHAHDAQGLAALYPGIDFFHRRSDYTVA